MAALLRRSGFLDGATLRLRPEPPQRLATTRLRRPRDEVGDLVPAGPLRELIGALLAASAEDRSVSVEELAERLGDEETQLLRQLSVAEDVLEEGVAARTIDDTLRWLRKERLKERINALTRSLRDPNADVKAILEEKERLAKQRLAASHHHS
jgi:hypothetical protein